jgi:Lantibiotic dehydratase, N terminus
MLSDVEIAPPTAPRPTAGLPEASTGNGTIDYQAYRSVLPLLLERRATVEWTLIANSNLTELAAILREERDLRGRCRSTASNVCDTLHRLVGTGQAAGVSRALLALKRDVHNDRFPTENTDQLVMCLTSLGHLQNDTSVVTDWLTARARREELSSRFHAHFEDHVRRSWTQLGKLIAHTDFRNGLLFSKPTMYRNVVQGYETLDYSEHFDTKKSSRIAAAIMKYAVRAAFKPTPFSSFAVTGLRTLSHNHGSARLVTCEMLTAKSSMRLNFAWLRHLASAIANSGVYDGDLYLECNSTVQREGARLRLLRRTDAVSNAKVSTKLALKDEDLVFCELPRTLGRLYDLIQSLLSGKRQKLSVVLSELSAHISDPSVSRRGLDNLLKLGAVRLGVPLEDDGADPAGAIRSFFRESHNSAAQDDGRLYEDIMRYTEELEAAEESARPTILQKLATRANELHTRLKADTKIDWEGRLVYEDVVDTASHGPVNKAPLDPFIASVLRFCRVLPLFDVHMFRRESARAAMHKLLGERPIPLLEFIPLYNAYHREVSSASRQTQASETAHKLNPFSLPSLATILKLRDDLRTGLSHSIGTSITDQIYIDESWLESLIIRIPAEARRNDWFTILWQPYTNSRSQQVGIVNELFSGPFRLLLRYFGTADVSNSQSRNLAILLDAVKTDVIGSNEMCEIAAMFGFNANHHLKISDREVAYDDSWLSNYGRIRLQDIQLGLDTRGDVKILDARTGLRITPVSLGMMSFAYQPVILSFLTMLSQPAPVGLRLENLLPAEAALQIADGISYVPRINFNSLTVSRATWRVSAKAFPRRERKESKAAYFRKLWNWRLDFGLPEETFVRSQASPIPNSFWDTVPVNLAGANGRAIIKPQYLSFDNWFLVDAFSRQLAVSDDVLFFEEVLPSTDNWRNVGCNTVREYTLDFRLDWSATEQFTR